MTNALLLVLSLLLAFVLPGYALTKALFPRRPPTRDYPLVAVAFLTLTLSLAVTVLAGAALGFLPHGEGARGYYQGAATGFPYLEITLASLTLVFFMVGVHRGAYPRLHRSRAHLVEPAPEHDPVEDARRGRQALAERVRALTRGEEARAGAPRVVVKDPGPRRP